MNNPGNIRYDSVPWEGLASPPSMRGFCCFLTQEDGVRALCRILLTYQDKYDLHCIEDWIARYAPPDENNTEAYILDMEARTHWRRDEMIDLRVPSNLEALAVAMCHHESGVWIDSLVIAKGAARALT